MTTLTAQFSQFCDEYLSAYRGIASPSGTASTESEPAAELITRGEALWKGVLQAGLFSSNETIDEYSTSTLELIWIPFILSDLYQRMRGVARPGEDGSREEVLKVEQSRQENILLSKTWFLQYLELMDSTDLYSEETQTKLLPPGFKESTMETSTPYSGPSREKRIQLSRERSAVENTWIELEKQRAYRYALRRRLARTTTAEASGSAEASPVINELEAEEDGELSELRRECALARLRFGFYEGCYQQDLSAREWQMLASIAPNTRAEISAHYQETLAAIKRGEMFADRKTYTILPDGKMMLGTLTKPQPVPLGSLPTGGIFAQQVRDELMIDRNPPTQTLQEFAEGEIAKAMDQQRAEAEMKAAQAEEDARLGEEGVEERARVKAADWDNWKDDNPRYGLSTKGNYA